MRQIYLLAYLHLGIFLFCSLNVSAQQQKISANSAFCPNSLSTSLCENYLTMLKDAAATNPQSVNEFKDAVSSAAKASLHDPKLWNAVLQSPVLSSKFSNLPITIQFKLLERESADAVIGMQFSYSKAFNQTVYRSDGDRERSYQFQLDINGVVTQNAEENPRNFISGKLAFTGRSMPSFNLKKLQAGLVPDYCDDEVHINDTQCFLLQSAGIQAFFEPMGAVYYLNYGADLGYETDQRFEAMNQTFGGFLFVAYEDMRIDTFMGFNNIKPSLRIAVETVDPNMQTPRVIAGDNSSYTRLSAEFSLIVPLQKLAGIPYYLTFNYQVYGEVGASDMVKTADLDYYQLKTYSLNTPTGIFVSYSSGRLPFGLENESTVELGFKTYF
jgi:hypothetical protein